MYFNISALTLILLTCVSYGVLYGFDRLFRKKEPDVFFAKLTITRQGKTVTLPAKIDTGLTLTEPFSGTPTIVADRRALGDILPPNFGMQSTENAVSMRLIPFSSLGADGVLPAFQSGCGFAFGHTNRMLGGRDRPHAFRREFSGARRRRCV